ncbi:hypothetical protein PTKIN_Ptkin12aG0025500 [Pterospermum kingtungense]
MEEPHSVNSPRRILSFSKRRRTTTASVLFDDKTNSGFGVSGEHGTKPSEVYGFVGSITTVVATVIFLVWAYIPEPWLHSVGIFYYPSRSATFPVLTNFFFLFTHFSVSVKLMTRFSLAVAFLHIWPFSV